MKSIGWLGPTPSSTRYPPFGLGVILGSRLLPSNQYISITALVIFAIQADVGRKTNTPDVVSHKTTKHTRTRHLNRWP